MVDKKMIVALLALSFLSVVAYATTASGRVAALSNSPYHLPPSVEQSSYTPSESFQEAPKRDLSVDFPQVRQPELVQQYKPAEETPSNEASFVQQQNEQLVTTVVEHRRELRQLKNELAERELQENLLRQKLEQVQGENQNMEGRLVETGRVQELETHTQQLQRELGRLNQQVAEFRNIGTEFEGMKADLDRANALVQSLREENAALESRQVGLDAQNKELAEGLQAELQSLKTSLSAKDKHLATAQQQLQESLRLAEQYKVALGAAEQRVKTIPALEKKLKEVENQVLLFETEKSVLGVSPQERLSSPIVDSISEPPVRKVTALPPQVPQQTPAPVARKVQSLRAPTTGAPSDILVVEVKSPKANLRTGPGDQHSPMMQIRQGTRLTVENQVGDWYLVYTPDGKRAYVSAAVVRPVSVDTVSTPSQVQQEPRSKLSAPSDDMEPFDDLDITGQSPQTPEETQAYKYLKSVFSAKDQ